MRHHRSRTGRFHPTPICLALNLLLQLHNLLFVLLVRFCACLELVLQQNRPQILSVVIRSLPLQAHLGAALADVEFGMQSAL
jgi:hypothetical protein